MKVTTEEKQQIARQKKWTANRMQNIINSILTAYNVPSSTISHRVNLPVATVHYLCVRDMSKPTYALQVVYDECIKIMLECDAKIAHTKELINSADN